jgi:hypothetical protein
MQSGYSGGPSAGYISVVLLPETERAGAQDMVRDVEEYTTHLIHCRRANAHGILGGPVVARQRGRRTVVEPNFSSAVTCIGP